MIKVGFRIRLKVNKIGFFYGIEVYNIEIGEKIVYEWFGGKCGKCGKIIIFFGFFKFCFMKVIIFVNWLFDYFMMLIFFFVFFDVKIVYFKFLCVFF